MTLVITNMAWPEDPYGTGQLWRKEPHLLAGFAVCWPGEPGDAMPLSYAVVYLRLHRTQPLDLTSGVNFGFRSVSAAACDEASQIVRLFDLDILRARRLAKIVTGFSLRRDLQAMGELAGGDAGRGIRGMKEGTGSSGMANVVDMADEHDRLQADVAAWLECDQHASPAADGVQAAEWFGACATGRALACAIATGGKLGRLTWEQPPDIGAAMTANAWDCFSSLDVSQPQAVAGGAV